MLNDHQTKGPSRVFEIEGSGFRVQGLGSSGRTEDHMLAVEPGGSDGGDEELRTVCVLASISHRQETGLGAGQGAWGIRLLDCFIV